MTRGYTPDSPPSWPLAGLIALIGFQLRSIIIGVPPVLPELRSDLHLSFSATGLLTALPVLGLGVAALPGAILINRFGARRIISAAAIVLGLAALLRALPPLPYSLFFWTSLLSLSIGIAQPALAVVVRNWFPGHIQQASTVYVLSLALGGLAGGALSVYLLFFGGWRGSFVIWALLALGAAGIWILMTPGRGVSHEPAAHGLGHLVRDRQVWHVAALVAGVSLVYFGSTTWIPFLLRGFSHDYLALVLLLFQGPSLLLTAILVTVRRQWARSRLWYASGSVLMVIGCVALMLELNSLAWLWALGVGLGCTMVFAGVSALPAMLAKTQADVAGYTALTLTVGNAFAFLGPLVGGILLDVTHIISSPFWVISAAAVVSVGLGATLSRAYPTVAPANKTESPAGSIH